LPVSSVVSSSISTFVYVVRNNASGVNSVALISVALIPS
jgi:hypothetical protein